MSEKCDICKVNDADTAFGNKNVCNICLERAVDKGIEMASDMLSKILGNLIGDDRKK